MQPSRPSIWLRDSNETASRKPGALQGLLSERWKVAVMTDFVALLGFVNAASVGILAFSWDGLFLLAL